MLRRLTPQLLGLLALSGSALSAEPAAEPYSVTVWASVLFAGDGRSSDFAIVDESRFSAKFVEAVKARLARAQIQPPHDQGAPATLRTGVRLEFAVTPGDGGGTLRLSGLAMGPLPVKQYFASYPGDIAQAGGWEGGVSATCTVGVAGTCSSIAVSALPGMPDSVRRYARASFERWIFEPQLLNGKPIEGEYTVHFSLQTQDSAPEDFRQSKFERILRKR